VNAAARDGIKASQWHGRISPPRRCLTGCQQSSTLGLEIAPLPFLRSPLRARATVPPLLPHWLVTATPYGDQPRSPAPRPLDPRLNRCGTIRRRPRSVTRIADRPVRRRSLFWKSSALHSRSFGYKCQPRSGKHLWIASIIVSRINGITLQTRSASADVRPTMPRARSLPV
jgi:hypothetical protein